MRENPLSLNPEAPGHHWALSWMVDHNQAGEPDRSGRLRPARDQCSSGLLLVDRSDDNEARDSRT